MDSYHSMIQNNLILLTKIFPHLDMESKIQKGMFKKPSTKGMQSVFYSLMYIINPEYCKKCVPWPVQFSSDNYKFRSSVIEFINKECPDFEVPTLLPSLLNKVDGEKYVRFVFNFVTYITQKILMLKFGEITLQKPNLSISYEENLNLLDDVIACNLADYEQKLIEHKNFTERSNSRIKSTVDEFQIKLKDYQSLKQVMFSDLKDALSFTNVIEESVLDCIFQSYEEELLELKNYLDKLKLTINCKLERKEYLIRLIKVKQEALLNIFDVDAFKTYINENLAQQIRVPLPVLLSTLFIQQGNTCDVQLLTFLRYGRCVIQKHMQRFLTLNLTDQQLTVYQTTDSLVSSTNRRLELLRQLCVKLDNMILNCKRSGIDFAGEFIENDASDSWIKLHMALKMYNSRVPHLRLSVIEKPLLIHLFRNEDDYDPLSKMKRRLDTVDPKN